MGIILPQFIKINVNNRYNKFYLDKGYLIENSTFNVSVLDLQERSAIKIKCQCDFCNKYFEKARCKIKDLKDTTACSKCAIHQAKKTCLQIYGVEYVWQSKEWL